MGGRHGELLSTQSRGDTSFRIPLPLLRSDAFPSSAAQLLNLIGLCGKHSPCFLCLPAQVQAGYSSQVRKRRALDN